MTDPHGFTESAARRIATQVKLDEAERPDLANGIEPPHAVRQLRPYHKLPAVGGAVAQVHPLTEADGFDFADLHNPCSDTALVNLRTTDVEKFTANETAFFEGTLFEQELALGFHLGGTLYLLGGNHVCVSGLTALDDNGNTVIELDDCAGNTVPFEWLVTPDEDIPEGTAVLALWVKARAVYVAVVSDCAEA